MCLESQSSLHCYVIAMSFWEFLGRCRVSVTVRPEVVQQINNESCIVSPLRGGYPHYVRDFSFVDQSQDGV